MTPSTPSSLSLCPLPPPHTLFHPPFPLRRRLPETTSLATVASPVTLSCDDAISIEVFQRSWLHESVFVAQARQKLPRVQRTVSNSRVKTNFETSWFTDRKVFPGRWPGRGRSLLHSAATQSPADSCQCSTAAALGLTPSCAAATVTLARPLESRFYLRCSLAANQILRQSVTASESALDQRTFA